ncbi:hypothetical protein D9M70_463070 [compost metagenome]
MAARLGGCEEIGFEYGHRPPDGDHVVAERPDLRRQELVLQPHRVEDVADHGREQTAAHGGKQFGIVFKTCHFSSLKPCVPWR